MPLITLEVRRRGKKLMITCDNAGPFNPPVLLARKQVYHSLLCSLFKGQDGLCFVFPLSGNIYQTAKLDGDFDKFQMDDILVLSSKKWKEADLQIFTKRFEFETDNQWFFSRDYAYNLDKAYDGVESMVYGTNEDTDVELVGTQQDGNIIIWTNSNPEREKIVFDNWSKLPFADVVFKD